MEYKTDEERERLIRADFKDHTPCIIHPTPDLTQIKWSRNDSWVNCIYYILHKNYLIAYGDLGDAVYQWHENLTLEFLGRLDLHYFASKCQASESGRGGLEWDPNLAEHKLAEDLKSQGLEKDEMQRFLKCLGGSLENPESWASYMAEFDPDDQDEEWSDVRLDDLFNIGKRPSFRTQYHLVGLKMIFEHEGAKSA